MAYDKPLSYSGISLYRRCPRAWKHTYIDGHRSPPAKAAMRGTRLHEALETYFGGGNWPEGNDVLRPWKAQMHEFATYFPVPEEQLAVLPNWTATTFDDEEAQYRGAVDLSYSYQDTLYILDWESGQQYSTHQDQADMYACLGMSTYDMYEKVEVSMVYLDIPKVITKWEYDAPKITLLKELWDEEADRLRLDVDHLPTPSQTGCKWCPLSWRNGGSCDKAP